VQRLDGIAIVRPRYNQLSIAVQANFLGLNVVLAYSIPRGLLLKIFAPGSTVSRPAFAITTAMYGRNIAPTSAIQRHGLGSATVRRKHAVRINIDMRYLRWRPARSLLRLFGAEVISKLSLPSDALFFEGFMR